MIKTKTPYIYSGLLFILNWANYCLFSFKIADMTLVDYYSSKYVFRLRHHIWPVLLAGKAPNIYRLPMETISIVAGQCYRMDLNEGQATKLLEVNT